MKQAIAIFVGLQLWGFATSFLHAGHPVPPSNLWVTDAIEFAPEKAISLGVSAKSRHITFSEDESIVATDQPPTIWNADTLEMIAVAKTYPRYSLGVELLDNNTLIAGSYGTFACYQRDDKHLYVSHRVGPTIRTMLSRGKSRHNFIRFHRESKTLTIPAANGQGSYVFDLTQKHPRAVSLLPQSNNCKMSDDLLIAVDGSDGKDVVIQKRIDGTSQFREFAKVRGKIFCLAPHGQLVTVDEKVYSIEDDKLRQVASLESVSKVAFAMNELQFAYVVPGRKIKIVRLQVGGYTTIAEIHIDVVPTTLAFSPSGKKLATVDPSVGLRLYEETENAWEETKASRERAEGLYPLKIIRFFDANRLLCQRTALPGDASLDETVLCFDLRSRKIVDTPELNGIIRPVGFNARQTSYSPIRSGIIAEQGSTQVALELEGLRHPVATLLRNGQAVRSWQLHELREVTLSPDGNTFAMGAYTGRIHLVTVPKTSENQTRTGDRRTP